MHKTRGGTEVETCLSSLVSQTGTGLDSLLTEATLVFRKSLGRAFSFGGLLLGSALLCVSATAQSAVPENGQSLNGVHTSTRPTPQAHPDIFSPSYVPPNSRPKPNAITAPRLVSMVDPQFPADAPEGKFSGSAVIALVVGTNGKPERVHVVKSLGTEFDKNAVAAVERYRFDPAIQHGKPVPVTVNVEVNFRRY